MKKIYSVLLLCLLSTAAFATRYFPNSVSTPAGSSALYCQGDMNVAYSATVSMCGVTSGSSTATNTITAYWYWNGTLVYTDPSPVTPASTAPYTITLPAGTFSLSPAGTYSLAGTGSGSGLVVQLYWTDAAPAGCTIASTGPINSSPLTIQVTAPLPAISGASSVCASAAVTLENSIPGGTWSSSIAAAATVGSTTGIVNGIAAGTTTITYKEGGCQVTKAMTVYALPAPVTGPAQVCIANTIVLADTTTGGTWVSSNPGVATVDAGTGTVTGIAMGASVISYVVNGCPAISVIAVNPNPVAIAPTSLSGICIGDTVALSNTSPGGTWTTPSTNIYLSSTGQVAGITAGSAMVSYTISTTGCYAIKPLTVNPNPAAITGFPYSCISSSTALGDLTSGGVWSSANTAIATVSGSGIVSGIAVGTTLISYTLSTGCYDTIKVTVSNLPTPITGADSVCAGGATISLSDMVAGGSWSSSNPTNATVGSSTGIVTGVATGTTNISYTTPGCPAAIHALFVKDLPAAITGTATVCTGQTTSLLDATPGGVWSSAGVANATVGATTGVVTGVAFGSATISYSVPGGCSISTIVTVYALAAVQGDDSVCQHGITYLSNLVGGGTWSSNTTTIATVNPTSGAVNGLLPGATYIVYTLPTGCKDSASFHVLNTPSAITGSMHICRGSIVTLSHVTPGGTWSSNNPIVATADATTGAITGIYPDTARIVYTLPHHCMVSALVTVNTPPTPSLTYDAAAGTLTVAGSYASYQWYDSTNGIITGATASMLVLPPYTASFYVIVTDANGCTGTASYYYVHPAGVSNVKQSGVHVYPNPADAFVSVESVGAVSTVISGVDGKVMITSNERTVDVSTLAPGVYVLSVYNEQGERVLVQKLVKQ